MSRVEHKGISRGVGRRLSIKGLFTLISFILLAAAGTSRAANVSSVTASPNPFQPPATTTISYSLTNSALLWIRIYGNSSVLKKNLATPGSYTSTNNSAGANSAVWDGKDNSGTTLSTGTYPYRMDNIYYAAGISENTIGGTNPQDIAVDPSNANNLWITDKSSSGYVRRSTNGGTSWQIVNTGATAKAYGIAVGNDGTNTKIYIANDGLGIIKSTNGGSSWSTVTPGNSNTFFDVATDSTGTIVYALNYNNGRVYKSTDSGSNWSQCGWTSFGNPASGVGTSPDGNTVIVADSPNNRIYKSTNGCSSFSQLTSITSGSGAGQVNFPYQVSVQADGSFWVSERDNHRIQLFDANGDSLMVAGAYSSYNDNYVFDSGTKYFGIGLSTSASQSYIFVADYNHAILKKFGYDNWTSTAHIQISSLDTTPPSNVTGFSVTNPQTGNTLNLSWTNPTNSDFAGVRIVRATGSTAPSSCLSGTIVYEGSNTSYSETSLTDGTQYSYRICSYDAAPNYSSGATGSGTPTDTTAPGNVVNLTAVAGNAQVTLSWNPPSDSDYAGVKVLRKTGSYPSSCSDSTATTVYTGSANSYTNTGLTNNTTYYYRVCAYDNTLNYASGATISATPYLDSTPPAQVSGFTVSNTGAGGKLSLSWTNPGDADFAVVKVVRATGSTAPSNCSSGTVVYNSNGTSFTDSGLTNGTTYAYRACSYDTSGNYSSGLTGSGTPSDTTPPGNISNFAGTAANAQVALSWTNPTDADFTGVKILRKAVSAPSSCADSSATQIYNGTATSYTDTGLTNGTDYYYLACAHDGVPNYASGVSLTKTPGSDTTSPSAVSDLSPGATIYTRGVNLKFTAPGDDGSTGTASSYDIRYTDALDYPSNVTATLMNTNWSVLTQSRDETAPQAAGSSESMFLQSDMAGAFMNPNTLYYFVLKTTDDFGNVSGISNVLPVHTALKYGYNTIGVPYKMSSGGTNSFNGLFGDEISSVYMYAWQPSGLDSGGYFSGDWVSIDSSSSLSSLQDGKGYYIYAYEMNSSVLDEKNSAGAAILTANSDAWTKIDLSQGRNLVGNPYLKNVDFSNTRICRGSTFSATSGCSGGTVATFQQAVTNGWIDGNIAYYGNSTTYSYETCSSLGCSAKLRPWWGQWIYLLDSASGYVIAVPKP